MSRLKDRIASMVFAFDDADRQDAVRALVRDVGALERELEQAKEDRARAAMDARNPLLARLAALEAEAKQAREDEAWAHERTVLVEFQPVTLGWVASTMDGVRGIMATAATLHGTLRALRAKVEGGAK